MRISQGLHPTRVLEVDSKDWLSRISRIQRPSQKPKLRHGIWSKTVFSMMILSILCTFMSLECILIFCGACETMLWSVLCILRIGGNGQEKEIQKKDFVKDVFPTLPENARSKEHKRGKHDLDKHGVATRHRRPGIYGLRRKRLLNWFPPYLRTSRIPSMI